MKICWMINRPRLHNVTVWSCVWTVGGDWIGRTLTVLKYCNAILNPHRTILFSCSPVNECGIECIIIPQFSAINEFNRFVNCDVPNHIDTEFAMAVHEDGFPIHPQLWTSKFLDFDYIGAPWPDGIVGNGGFSIESKRLLKAKLRLPKTGILDYPSDNWICRVHRKRLEHMGIVFAPARIALQFSTETIGNEIESFGFHGRTCCPHKYNLGWETIQKIEHAHS